MNQPCCLGVVRDAAALQGTTLSVGGAPAYAAQPATSEKKVWGQGPHTVPALFDV